MLRSVNLVLINESSNEFYVHYSALQDLNYDYSGPDFKYPFFDNGTRLATTFSLGRNKGTMLNRKALEGNNEVQFSNAAEQGQFSIGTWSPSRQAVVVHLHAKIYLARGSTIRIALPSEEDPDNYWIEQVPNAEEGTRNWKREGQTKRSRSRSSPR